MSSHAEKVARVVERLKARTGHAPVSFKKKAPKHQVPRRGDKRYEDEKIDLSDLDAILDIDPSSQTCLAEPGVTFERLVEATLPYGLVPTVVPELKTITLGGAVAGCSIESMSYRYGGFHDSCLSYEIVTAKGDVLHCAPDNEHALVFQMAHGTFGTLGIITQLRFRLVPAKPFVRVTYLTYADLASYQAAIRRRVEAKDVDFMDGIIHSPKKYVLSLGQFVDEAPYTHAYDWMRVYWKSTGTLPEDYLRTSDYFFRYDKGVTNVTPKSFVGRLLLGKFLDSDRVLRLAERLRKVLPDSAIPVTLDTFIPSKRVAEFMEWYGREIGHFPLWCVPYRRVRPYEWIDGEFLKKAPEEDYLDIAVYGLKKRPDKDYYRMFETKLMEIGGIKTLITPNYYSPEEFWSVWNRRNYEKVKGVVDPDNIFRDLYDKMVLAARGL